LLQLGIGVISVCILALMQDFIILWLSEFYLLSFYVVVFLVANLYIRVMQSPFTILFGALGYYRYDKIIVMISALINILISVVLVFVWGIAGVLVGTTVALAIYWISRAIIVYRKFFCGSMRRYLNLLIRCLGATACSVAAIFAAKPLLPMHSLQWFVIKGFVYVAIAGLINLLFLYRTDEFKNLKGRIRQLMTTRRKIDG